jgi:ABC-type nickel/cobalt efflux system permease component RcnA
MYVSTCLCFFKMINQQSAQHYSLILYTSHIELLEVRAPLIWDIRLFWCCRQVYLLGLWQICSSQTSRRLFSVKCHSRNQKLQLRAAAAFSHQSVCALHTFCPNANSRMAEYRKSKILHTLLAFVCMRAAAITPPRQSAFPQFGGAFLLENNCGAESGVGGGRRRVLVAQTAYCPANSFPGRAVTHTHTHTHAAHTNTHTTESAREREKSWQCKISEYATFPLQRKNVG